MKFCITKYLGNCHTLIFGPKLDVATQTILVKKFNSLLDEYRNKYDLMFLSIELETAQKINKTVNISRNIFIKLSPLLDPVKYMTGKYDLNDPTLLVLPSLSSNEENCHKKTL